MGDERPLKLAVIITGFWRTHGICGGEGDGGGGGCGGRESERVAAGTGQARLFMIGSEEEQKEEEVEVAPVARRRRRRREGRCSSVASFMGEGFRWKEFDAGRGRESREMKKERRNVWNSSMDGAATTCCFLDNLAEVLMEFINLQAIIDKFTTEMRFKSERRLRDYTSYPPLAEGRVSSLYSVELINCVIG